MEFERRDYAGINSWYRRCQEKQVPAVWIETRRTLADIFWDCASLPPIFDQLFVSEREERVQLMLWGVYQAVARPRSRIICGFFYGHIKSLEIADAIKVAKIVSKLLFPEIRRVKKRIKYIR